MVCVSVSIDHTCLFLYICPSNYPSTWLLLSAAINKLIVVVDWFAKFALFYTIKHGVAICQSMYRSTFLSFVYLYICLHIGLFVRLCIYLFICLTFISAYPQRWHHPGWQYVLRWFYFSLVVVVFVCFAKLMWQLILHYTWYVFVCCLCGCGGGGSATSIFWYYQHRKQRFSTIVKRHPYIQWNEVRFRAALLQSHISYAHGHDLWTSPTSESYFICTGS